MNMRCKLTAQGSMGIPEMLAVALLAVFAGMCTGCARDEDNMKGGHYTAEAADYDLDGWKEYLSIYVFNNKIVAVTYDAKNAAGFAKSWDTNLMRDMKSTLGTYPNKYARAYVEDLLNKQSPAGVRAVPRAARFRDSFVLLAEAAIAQSKAGDTQVIFIDLAPVTEKHREPALK